MVADDDFLQALIRRLQEEHECHAVILYGSRARGDASGDSDYDVLGITDGKAAPARHSGYWLGALLDVFVYAGKDIVEEPARFLHLRGGLLLLDSNGVGADFLSRIEAAFVDGPEQPPPYEVAARRVWAWKMLDRVSRGDVEANYRRAWLLTSQLENYFYFKGQWCPGSKEAFSRLANEDPVTFDLFEAALLPNAPISSISALIGHVNGPRPVRYD